jgi:AGCS family alanine or glycine:cation symporter
MNAVGDALSGVFHIPAPLTCGLLALVTLAVLFSGRNGILKFSEMLVPIMTLGYIILSVAVFIMRADRIDDAFVLIFKNAFTKSSAVSGIGGYILSAAIRYGVMRGVVSNEAGCGTAPAAHAVSNCKHPAEQGVWGIFEVFADTIVLCTMTALVVIIGYDSAALYENDFMMMTISAYAASLGKLASVFISTAVLCFGLATIVCWAHYGSVCAKYLADRRWVENAFIAVYCSCVAIGCFISSTQLWGLADLAMGLMTVINLFVLIGMWKEVKEETDVWIKK